MEHLRSQWKAAADKPRYIEVTEAEAKAAPRTFVGIGAHRFLCLTSEEADQYAAIGAERTRWFVWSEDV